MNKDEQMVKLKESLLLNFNDFYNKEVKEVASKLVRLITSGKPLLRIKYKGALIDSYKFLSEVEYLEKNYESCLNHIKQLQLSEAYKNETDSTIMHATIRRFQCEVFLGIYQESYEKIKTLKMELTEFGSVNRHKLEKNLMDDYDKIFDLARSFLNNSVKTIVNFKLPYKIDIPENEEVIYDFKSIRFNLKFKTIANQGQVPFEAYNGVLELDRDKYGVYSFSDLTLTFNKFFDATHCIDELLDLCSESFNYFLDCYKSSTEYYWIDNLNIKQIQASNVMVISENYDDVISIPFYYAHGIKGASSPSYINKEKFNELKDKLIEGQEPPLWEMLYLNSKNNMFLEKHKEAVISINSAFENYLNIKSREILRSKMIEEEVEDYLQGEVSYATYFLKEFISEENFNKAVEEGTINSHSPSTFQIIKKCFEFNDNNRITISKREINKLVNNIRKNRNDIIHGNLTLVKNIESDVKKSISSFEKFIKVFK
ncbi:hypothetical protein [Clostridium algidicarnis]|uniref:hypothetical protein n=1 Tax=Clostridium algidicarnis TaxID=37659 RepID=UPI001C0B112C|nr:hypothetical protein [Clostridium algidicarnis]MBU3228632.1 hypothetical protein [Clostridium algidicarnis]MBU3251322.1 hypothetical protein [Clostridium algidicarnis]